MVGKEILLGDLRGSLAGITASRNASKSFLRQRVSPVQPNTAAQIRAKANFGLNSGIYRQLPALSRGSWTNFAKTIYTSRKSPNTGQFTGQMAFQAISTSYQTSVNLGEIPTWLVNGVVPNGGTTFSNFIFNPNTPPLKPSSVGIQKTDGNNNPFTLKSVEVFADGSGSFELYINKDTPQDLKNVLNASNSRFGYAVYISSANVALNLYYRNLVKYCITYLKPVQVVVPAVLSSTQIFKYSWNSLINPADYQGFPIGGNAVMMSVYQVTENLQSNLIGRLEVGVSLVP